MAIYTYLYAEDPSQAKAVQEEIQKYVESNRLKIDRIIEEDKPVKSHWQKREIGELLEKGIAKAGDSIIVYEAADLARSTSQMLEILTSATLHHINIHFAKYNVVFEAKASNRTKDLINILQHIESDFISRRTTDALARRRAAGLPLGRPKGRKNKNLKLDKFKKDIVKYLDLQISKASIAKLVGCHPQTLYDWIDRHAVPDKKARKPRKTTAVAKTTSKQTVTA
jgi:DNA invertase Pin-like site-specific DNA recombinase